MDRLELDRPEPDRLELDRPEPDRRTGPDPDPDRTRTGVTSAEQRLPIMDHGSRIMDHGSKIMDHGSWIMDHGSWIMDQGSWTLDLGLSFGMNDQSGRDTDVISKQSESTIEDLSFYIGFVTPR